MADKTGSSYFNVSNNASRQWAMLRFAQKILVSLPAKAFVLGVHQLSYILKIARIIDLREFFTHVFARSTDWVLFTKRGQWQASGLRD